MPSTILGSGDMLGYSPFLWSLHFNGERHKKAHKYLNIRISDGQKCEQNRIEQREVARVRWCSCCFR